MASIFASGTAARGTKRVNSTQFNVSSGNAFASFITESNDVVILDGGTGSEVWVGTNATAGTQLPLPTNQRADPRLPWLQVGKRCPESLSADSWSGAAQVRREPRSCQWHQH
jgi:hypothetical protein